MSARKDVANPGSVQWNAVRRVCRYLAVSKVLSEYYGWKGVSLIPHPYMDADWTGGPNFLQVNELMCSYGEWWRCQLICSPKIGRGTVFKETVWIRRLVQIVDILTEMNKATVMFVDN